MLQPNRIVISLTSRAGAKLRYNGGMALEIFTCTEQDYKQILMDLQDFWDDRDTSALHHPMLVNEFGNSAFVIRAGPKVIAYLFGFVSQVEPVGYVHLIAVRPSTRRQRLGRGFSGILSNSPEGTVAGTSKLLQLRQI